MATDDDNRPEPPYKAECAKCGGIRNCDVHGVFVQRGGDEYFDWTVRWRILQCRGCEHVFTQTASSNSEEYDHFEDENGEDQVHYPEALEYWPAISKRVKPEWLREVGFPKELWSPIWELYGALEADLRLLAAIGIRTTFDVAAMELSIDSSLSFNQKLDMLIEGDFINGVDKGRLASIIDAGSASAHRGWLPSADDISTMMEVLEHFIEKAFVAPARQKLIEERVAELRQVVPRRARKRIDREALPDAKPIPAPEKDSADERSA